MNEQWQITSNRDITKFVSRFATEILVTNQAFRALHEFFSVVRTNTTKLIQKAQKVTNPVPQVTAVAKTTKESMTVNEVTVHKQPTSKQIRKSTKKVAGEIFEVHSKTPISNSWKQWFKKKGIHFIED